MGMGSAFKRYDSKRKLARVVVKISAIKAFSDNYIWLLLSQDGQSCAVVDPGDATPVIQTLDEMGVNLEYILITHHHFDHTGGANDLASRTGAQIFGPSREAQGVVQHPLVEGDMVELPKIDATYQVIDIPGHTLGHIAYYGGQQVYCGDTLFAAGCGRVFEGTNAQMLDSLGKLAGLADETAVYCGHEYTLANLQFALAVEPNNPDIQSRFQQVSRFREQNINTLPSNIGLEKATNPFLRCHTDAVKRAAEQYLGKKVGTLVEIFGIIRDWKNRF